MTTSDIIALLYRLDSLCMEVASLDDAGLTIPHKSAIAKARKLASELDPPTTRKWTRTKTVRGVKLYEVSINGETRWVSIPESHNHD